MLVDVEEPIKLALAILNDVVGVILTTNAEVLDVLTITAEPLVVAVALLKMVTVSVLDDVVL